MTRDPSDGSVREKIVHESNCKWCHEFPPKNRKDGFCSDICKEWFEREFATVPGMTHQLTAPVIDTSTSGLPMTKAKAAYLERLEESRKWLKEYVQKTINV